MTDVRGAWLSSQCRCGQEIWVDFLVDGEAEEIQWATVYVDGERAARCPGCGAVWDGDWLVKVACDRLDGVEGE